MATRFSIQGQFFDWSIDNWVDFSGEFTAQNGAIRGSLIDYIGRSNIEGEIGEDTLSFRKQYEHHFIDYVFAASDGVLTGHYVVDGGFEFPARCEINQQDE
jgi:hypothetical protein